MRYGLALPTGGECGDPRFLLELSVLAEQHGWDGVFFEDYVFYQATLRVRRRTRGCRRRQLYKLVVARSDLASALAGSNEVGRLEECSPRAPMTPLR